MAAPVPTIVSVHLHRAAKGDASPAPSRVASWPLCAAADVGAGRRTAPHAPRGKDLLPLSVVRSAVAGVTHGNRFLVFTSIVRLLLRRPPPYCLRCFLELRE